jgi:hypothetical protein
VDETIHNETGIQIYNEDRRSRRVMLTLKLVYLAIHKGSQQVLDGDPQMERSAEQSAVS